MINFVPRYEFVIAHLVPGTISSVAAILLIDCSIYPGVTSEQLVLDQSFIKTSIVISILISIILFMGLLLDAIKSVVVKEIFIYCLKKEKIEVKNYLKSIERIKRKNYEIVLNEYYYYYESAVNCALALLLWIFVFTCWWTKIILLLVLLFLLYYGYVCYKNFVTICNHWS